MVLHCVGEATFEKLRVSELLKLSVSLGHIDRQFLLVSLRQSIYVSSELNS